MSSKGWLMLLFKFDARWLNVFCGVIICVLLSGCTTTSVRLNVVAANNLNLNALEEPLPVVIRIYQLTDAQRFRTATFEELWKSDKSILAGSLLTVEERIVNPSQQLNVEFEQADNARYIGVFALFRNRSQQQWRLIQSLDEGRIKLSTSLDILLTSNAITLPGQREEIR